MSILDAARDPKGRVRCARCGQPFPDKDIQVDHIHPEADGGGHDPANLQALCTPKVGGGCHRLKSREEAKARAKAVRAAKVSPLRKPLGLLGLSTGLWSVGLGLEVLLGHDAAAYVQRSQHVSGYLLMGGAALGAALVGARLRPVPLQRPGETTAEPVTSALTERVTTAARTVMGDVTFVVNVRSEDAFSIAYRGTGFADHSDTKREELVSAVAAKTEARWMPTWDTQHDVVRFARRPALPSRIDHPGFDPDRPWYKIPIGPGCEINLKTTSHVLVVGKTNMGKTGLIRDIVVAVSNSEATAILLDPKRVELVGFRGWPGVTNVLTTDAELWAAPLALLAEMNERYRLFEEKKVPLSSHKPIVMVCDEYEQYVIRMTNYWLNEPGLKRPGQKIPPAVQAMASLLSMARKCGIHVVIGTQRPDASWFGGSARDNMACRIAVGGISLDAARMIWGAGNTDHGRDIPDTKKGRATVQLGDGEYIEVQTYWTPDPGDSDETNTPGDWAILTNLRGRSPQEPPATP